MAVDEMMNLIDEVVFPYAHAKVGKARRERRRFVHYTSSEAALSIIKNQEIWLRNCAVMNDYSEIAHGEACMRSVLYDEELKKLSSDVFEKLSPGMSDRVISTFENSSAMRRTFSYILSISEHGPIDIKPGMLADEGEWKFGRLSMWRAYANNIGVGLVFAPTAFLTDADALNAYMSPVFYGSIADFRHQWMSVLLTAQRRLDELAQLPDGLFEANIIRAIHFAIIATKHPGFSEEREWRVTYSADPASEQADDSEFNSVSRMKREFRTVNGVPQRIYKVPMVNYPEEGFVGATLSEALERVIIGPSQYPIVVYDAIHAALTAAGISDASKRIVISDIPIRT
jgi:hypothetical protein